MGAEIIRFDAIGGGPDFRRWPKSPEGASFYWEGLNKGKKSIALDLSKQEGRELAVSIVTAPGQDAGLFVTNYPINGFLAHDKLAMRRPDLISVRVMGWADGGAALDYTINSAIGIPLMTGPAELRDQPVNHVLPAWDLIAGLHGAVALLAAERRRKLNGQGEEIRVPLGDVAVATLGHLGQIAEVGISGADRPRMGNDIFGTFGRDFVAADGQRIMLVALTKRHWADLVKSLGIDSEVATIEKELNVTFAVDEGVRFVHRDRLNPVVAKAVVKHSLSELATKFKGTGVCWGPYNKLSEAIKDERLIAGNPLFAPVTHVSGYTYPTPGAATTLRASAREAPRRAPMLGEHTDEILAQVLGLPQHEIARLHDVGTVAGPAPSLRRQIA
jgi:2-methylfumaryl-CoA isomerase